MQQRRLGERAVGAVGLGAMPMSVSGRPPREQSIRTIHAALDAGMTLIDTADAYCLDASDTGHNERLVGEAVRSWSGDRDAVVVATKGGHVRSADGAWLVDGRPEHLRRACDASLAALGMDAIDLYQFHRPDPAVPFAESVGALADLLSAGKIRMAGVSNASVDQIRQATAIVRLVSVQNQFSPAFLSSASELAFCADQGIAFLAWSPLGGMRAAGQLGALHEPFANVAARHGVSAQQVCLAWELAQADVMIPIPGSSRPETARDSAAAAGLVLDAEDLALLGAAVAA